MMGAGILGLLAVATGVTLFQPHRISSNRKAQIALRCLGVLLAAVSLWVAWNGIQRSLISR